MMTPRPDCFGDGNGGDELLILEGDGGGRDGAPDGGAWGRRRLLLCRGGCEGSGGGEDMPAGLCCVCHGIS